MPRAFSFSASTISRIRSIPRDLSQFTLSRRRSLPRPRLRCDPTTPRIANVDSMLDRYGSVRRAETVGLSWTMRSFHMKKLYSINVVRRRRIVLVVENTRVAKPFCEHEDRGREIDERINQGIWCAGSRRHACGHGRPSLDVSRRQRGSVDVHGLP